MVKKNKYTGDLFGIEDCLMCKGEGEIMVYDNSISIEYTKDCEDCDGTGLVGGKKPDDEL